MVVLEVAYTAARCLGRAGRTWTTQWRLWRRPLACLNV